MKEAGSIEDKRPWVALVAICVGVLIVVVLYNTLHGEWARTFLDSSFDKDGKQIGSFPISVQNGMWIAFALGLGEIGIRVASARAEMRQLRMEYLPEDPSVILQSEDLPALYQNLKSSPDRNRCFLPRLIDRCILQFQASQSSGQSASLLNTSVEMFLHEVDLRYNMIRYICWVIPSLGFIGTVVGIGRALEYAGDEKNVSDPLLLTNVTNLLAVSFNGTFVALVQASILVLLQNIIQSKEEHALNLAGQYCLDNLINRLYVAK